MCKFAQSLSARVCPEGCIQIIDRRILARDLGLWTVSKLPPLKRFFMRDAMGLTGDVPEMMKENS